MCATTELDRFAISYHTHFVTVFLTEQSHCTHRTRFFNGNVAMLVARHCLTDAAVYYAFDRRYLSGSHFLKVGEVKTQHFGRYK